MFLNKKNHSAVPTHGTSQRKEGKKTAEEEEEEGDEEIRPTRWLYDRQKIEGYMRWTAISRIGAGVHAFGNAYTLATPSSCDGHRVSCWSCQLLVLLGLLRTNQRGPN